jgi:hypothetical protein
LIFSCFACFGAPYLQWRWCRGGWNKNLTSTMKVVPKNSSKQLVLKKLWPLRKVLSGSIQLKNKNKNSQLIGYFENHWWETRISFYVAYVISPTC